MKIPAIKTERDTLYLSLIESCFASQADRSAQYNILRNWYLFGTGSDANPVEYNKMFSHIDLYSSYLFSGETTSFVIEIPETADIDLELQNLMAEQIMPKLVEMWHDSNTDIIFNEALTWALVFGTAFVKLVPLGKKEIAAYIVMPHNVGVLREDVPSMYQQEAVAHEYIMTESQLERRIKDFSEDEKAIIRGYLKHQEKDEKADTQLPTGVRTLVINSTVPDTGAVQGQVDVNQLLKYDFESRTMEPGVMCQELYVYDDDLCDYRTVTAIERQYILYDAEKNVFVKNEIPLIKITPNMLANYFWGRSELMFITKLQEWINVRIPQIKKILAKLADPPTSAFGVTESKVQALMQAAGIAAFPEMPSMAKIEQHYPKEVNDLFRELNLIEDMFNEVSGIRDIMRGGGETGVRSGGHADLLARLGSSRVKKKAFILEDAVNLCAHLLLQIVKRDDATYYKTKKTETRAASSFIAKQLTDTATVKVDSHSSSPIFLEQQLDNAKMLFEAGAIDKEDLIDAVRYRNAAFIKNKLRQREKAAAEQAAAEASAEKEQGGQK